MGDEGVGVEVIVCSFIHKKQNRYHKLLALKGLER